jgi:hypothetical protein
MPAEWPSKRGKKPKRGKKSGPIAARAEANFEETTAITTHITSHLVGIVCQATIGSWITLSFGRLVDLISRAKIYRENK